MTLSQTATGGISETATPAVSIAIRASRRRWLGQAIDSVLGQTFGDLELVVYDDAGDLHDLIAQYDDPRVHYHRAKRELGASGRFAAAVEHCRGRYIGVLDDDDHYAPEFVATLFGVLEDDPSAGVAFCRTVWDLGDRVVVPVDDRPAGRVAGVARDTAAGRYVIQPSLTLMRREALEDAERIQPLTDGIAADIAVNLHAAVAGWGHVLVDEPLVTRRWHGEQVARGNGAFDVAVSTWGGLVTTDPELDRLRSEQHSRALLRRAVARMAAGDNVAARADLNEARRVDAAAWSWPRRLMQTAARAGPLGRVAASAWLASPAVRRRRDLPPDGVRDQRPGHGVGHDTLTLAAGTVAAQVLLIAVAPILTRLFTPAQIGASSVLVGVMGIWAIACLQLDWATRSRAGAGRPPGSARCVSRPARRWPCWRRSASRCSVTSWPAPRTCRRCRAGCGWFRCRSPSPRSRSPLPASSSGGARSRGSRPCARRRRRRSRWRASRPAWPAAVAASWPPRRRSAWRRSPSSR